MRRRRIVRVAWILGTLVVLVLALQYLVADVYRVTSSSMLPTLRPGDYVLVRFDGGLPERGELVVHRRGGEAVVKRVVGLPGDEVLIERSGDVFLNGTRATREERGAPSVVVFDQALHAIPDHFQLGSSDGNPWTASADGYELDAREIEAGRAAGLMRLHKGVHDDVLDADGSLVYGMVHVGDVIVRGELRALEPGGRVRLLLLEQGDTFELTLELDDEARVARASLVREGAGQREELVATDASSPLTAWTPFRFENVDNRLRFALSGEAPLSLEASYEENRPHPRDLAGDGLSIGERVQLGGEGCRLALRSLRIERDLSYTRRGDVATRGPLRLGPDEVFVLGDNSRGSRDSREFGPLRTSEVFGRAVWVVWPPSAVRRLR